MFYNDNTHVTHSYISSSSSNNYCGVCANITGHITNNAVLNFDDDKHTFHELFHITFEVYNPDPLMSRNFQLYTAELVENRESFYRWKEYT